MFLHLEFVVQGVQKAATGTQVRLFFVSWVPGGLLVQRVRGFGGCENIFVDFGAMHVF